MTGLFFRVAGLGLALAAAPALAEGGPTPETVDRLVKAIEANGCTIDDSNQDKILAEAKLSEPEAEVVVSKLVDEGKAVIEDADVHLTTGACK